MTWQGRSGARRPPRRLGSVSSTHGSALACEPTRQWARTRRLRFPTHSSFSTPPPPGYLFTYYNTKITEERKAQIERINEQVRGDERVGKRGRLCRRFHPFISPTLPLPQVRDLYGPLLATVNASKTAYAAMVRQHSPDGTGDGFVAAVRAFPSGAEASVYRTWMRDVLQPLNERAAAIVVQVRESVCGGVGGERREERERERQRPLTRSPFSPLPTARRPAGSVRHAPPPPATRRPRVRQPGRPGAVGGGGRGRGLRAAVPRHSP